MLIHLWEFVRYHRKRIHFFPNIPFSFSLLHDFYNCLIYVSSRKCSETTSIYPLLKYLEDNFVLRLKNKNKQTNEKPKNQLSWVKWVQVSLKKDQGKLQLFLWHNKSSISFLLHGTIEIIATSYPSKKDESIFGLFNSYYINKSFESLLLSQTTFRSTIFLGWRGR